MEYFDLPVARRVQISQLFNARNFCFATATHNRSPTFYFAEGGLINLNTALRCGRLRTSHRSGPLIDMTNSPKGHIFFDNLADRDQVRRDIRNTPAIARRQALNIVENQYRTQPRNGDYHYEYTKTIGQINRISRRHASGGRIVLAPRPSDNQIRLLIARLLADGCQITLDRAIVSPLGASLNLPIVAGVTPYLNSLG